MASSTESTPKYVYGVVRAGHRPVKRLTGIDDAPVSVVAFDDLGALTSEAADEYLDAGRDELLTHSRVLETSRNGGVVLPMRFGVVMPSDDAIRDELLAPNHEELAEQLGEMDGKAEINIKGIYE